MRNGQSRRAQRLAGWVAAAGVLWAATAVAGEPKLAFPAGQKQPLRAFLSINPDGPDRDLEVDYTLTYLPAGKAAGLVKARHDEVRLGLPRGAQRGLKEQLAAMKGAEVTVAVNASGAVKPQGAVPKALGGLPPTLRTDPTRLLPLVLPPVAKVPLKKGATWRGPLVLDQLIHRMECTAMYFVEGIDGARVHLRVQGICQLAADKTLKGPGRLKGDIWYVPERGVLLLTRLRWRFVAKGGGKEAKIGASLTVDHLGYRTCVGAHRLGTKDFQGAADAANTKKCLAKALSGQGSE